MRGVRRALLLLLSSSLVLLAACQSQDPVRQGGERDNRASIHMLQRVNAQAQQCWRGEREFRELRIIPELDTRFGKPRILLVAASAPQGLPKLVIEAEGTPARISTYGPLADLPVAARIESDVARWSRGEKGCEA